MKHEYYDPIFTVMDQAQATMKLYDEVLYLRQRVKELEGVEKEYRELLNSSIRHSHNMMGGTLNLLLTPGVADALRGQKS